MSDALSDSARDQQRTEASREMWQAFGAFAKAPSAERKQAVLEAAKAVDSINGGYRGGRTSRASRTVHRIEGIERGDPAPGPVSLSSPSTTLTGNSAIGGDPQGEGIIQTRWVGSKPRPTGSKSTGRASPPG